MSLGLGQVEMQERTFSRLKVYGETRKKWRDKIGKVSLGHILQGIEW
jgi:hypothetical protein